MERAISQFRSMFLDHDMLKRLFALFTEKKTKMVATRKIDTQFDVAGQIAPDQAADIAARGYRTLICMRPDNEGFNQPAFSDVKQAAETAGMEAIYFPVVPGSMAADQARELKAILAGRQGPVLAYCASGNRCAAAYELSRRV